MVKDKALGTKEAGLEKKSITQKILVMGVSGCGKSHVGNLLAQQLGFPFFDGDDFHPEPNVEKMKQGIPLTDQDRIGWLHTLNQLFLDNDQAVIACSALKPEYRDILRHNNNDLVIVYLQGDFDTIWKRHQKRNNHWFNGKSMLESQFDALIEPQTSEAIFVNISPSISDVIINIHQQLDAYSLEQGAPMTSTLKTPQCHIAMIGLGVMGKSLTLNLLDNGFNVAGFDLNSVNSDNTAHEAEKLNKGQFFASSSLEYALNQLPSPRVIALSVPAGDIVDTVIQDLLNADLEPDDIVIDTGNSLWTDTIARDKKYQGQLNFFSTAVSGGEQGARFGPALMASGDPKAWQYVKPMWNAIAAKVDPHGMPVEPLQDGEACATYTGPSGSGHYVKMVHNGIEYADMQIICEVYQYLHQVIGLEAAKIGDIFSQWNQGVLNSYLMEISADILQQKDFHSDKPLVEMILDKAGQKGTGVWTAINSLEVGCPAPSIAQSVYARSLSSLKERRLQGEQKLAVVTEPQQQDSLNTTIAELHDALYCAKLCIYAQGFDLMKTTSEQQGWQLDFAQIAKGWRAGCIIRAVFLQSITQAFETSPQLDNLLFDQKFGDEIKARQLNWRRCVAHASLYGVAIPGIGSALSYFDSMRCATLPANLLQAQRDYFGSHTYSRIDQPETQKYHVEWSQNPRVEIQK